MRVLVCGGRSYGVAPGGNYATLAGAKAMIERGIMCRALDDAKARGAVQIIHGGAGGADAFAARWARDHGLSARAFPADWEQHGRAAGPLRNARMIAEGRPDLVIAFPGGRGTADCVRKAEAAGIPVVRPAETAPLPALVNGEGRQP